MGSHLHLARRAADVSSAASPLSVPIRVVLADDHALVRHGLRLLLAGECDVEVVAEVADLHTVERHVGSHGPHVLVLDVELPASRSLEAIRRMRGRFPGTEIVVLTMEQSPAFAQRVLEAGAIGYVLKDRAELELPVAVRSAGRGAEFISPWIGARLHGSGPR